MQETCIKCSETRAETEKLHKTVGNDALLGFPVVEIEAVPETTVLFGRPPTPGEIRERGSYEAAVKALAEEGQWASISHI
jgi:hypothetical protein